ncbi:MliC family protein [Dickeya lacustris]|uniref:MliC family protein n=1 Tax=Dickeya lacustris TaxID=2259638 RepID=A0ABY8G905_9GAMM|nr:MliC family protein [Dickeya lacustris]WFN56446.1 MliC family protein [Dickeya lacustris]
MKPLVIAAVVMLSGCARLVPSSELKTLHYQCGTMPLTVSLHVDDMRVDGKGETASFLFDGERLTLHPVASAAGHRYSDGKYTFWYQGRQAWVMRDDRVIVNDCVLR